MNVYGKSPEIKMETGMRKSFIAMALVILGTIIGRKTTQKQSKIEIQKNHEMSEKHFALFLMMNQWVKVKQEGKQLSEYLKKKGYKTIAIYGMSYAGETLADELGGTDITVSYGIDKNADMIYSFIDVVHMEDELKAVDAVVVTSVTSFEEIKQKLKSKISCPVISLEDILYDI